MIGHMFPGLRCFGTHQSILGHYKFYHFMFYHVDVSLEKKIHVYRNKHICAFFSFLISFFRLFVALLTRLSKVLTVYKKCN